MGLTEMPMVAVDMAATPLERMTVMCQQKHSVSSTGDGGGGDDGYMVAAIVGMKTGSRRRQWRWLQLRRYKR